MTALINFGGLNMDEWKKFKNQNWNAENVVFHTYEWGTIHFSRIEFKKLVGRGNMTYDDYLDLMKASANKCRKGFELVFYDGGKYGAFKGEIEKVNKTKVCFKRIYIEGTYPDGSFFEEKEDHVWMDKFGFERCHVGDCVNFCAEVYRYVKTGNGKMLDYGLRNPKEINKVEKYDLPSYEKLLEQTIDAMTCDVCSMSEYCSEYCFNNERRKQLKHTATMLIQDKFSEKKG